MKSYIYSHILCFALVTLIGCSQQSTLPEDDVLVVGMTANYHPYESYDRQGNIVGFDVDIASTLAKKLKKRLVIKDLTFDALVLSLKQGKIDVIISGMSITSSRQKEITMVPYQGNEIHELTLAFWKEVSPGVDSIDTILINSDSTITVMVGTFQEEYLSKVAGGRLKALDANTDLILDLRYGKSIAALFEPHIAIAMKKQFPELQLVTVQLDKLDWVLGNGIGVKKENTHLVSLIEKAVLELKQEGTISKLESDWFEEEYHVD